MAEPESGSSLSVRERLDQALISYLASFEADDLAVINIEQIAQLAGVGRATAYRHFGDQNGLLFDAATKLARHHTDTVITKIKPRSTVITVLEEAFSYTAYAMRTDPLLRLLMTSQRSRAINDAVAALGRELLGPVIRAGQRDGQVRADVSDEDLLIWVSEMQYVAIRLSLDEDAVRDWVRTFMLPTLNPVDPDAALIAQVTAVLADVEQRSDALKAALAQARLPVKSAVQHTSTNERRPRRRRD